jgi:hypothetical protein
MSRNYDIKTVSKAIVTGSATIIGGVVATGMKRYVTFMHVAPTEAGGTEGVKLYLASTATAPSAGGASTITKASAAQKMVVIMGSATATNSMSVPAAPDTEHPLFTVASGKYLSAFVGATAGLSGPVNLFLQYFDE